MSYRITGKVRRRVFDSRQIWKHNALLGTCKRAELAMRAVYDSETTTDECRDLAAKIEGQVSVLYRLLKTRRDQVRG